MLFILALPGRKYMSKTAGGFLCGKMSYRCYQRADVELLLDKAAFPKNVENYLYFVI